MRTSVTRSINCSQRRSKVPQLGFGIYQTELDEVQGVTELALDAGYRHIDTAAAYANEAGVGQAVRNSGISRGEIVPAVNEIEFHPELPASGADPLLGRPLDCR